MTGRRPAEPFPTGAPTPGGEPASPGATPVDGGPGRPHPGHIPIPGRRLRLPFFLGLVTVTTLGGALLMLDIMRANGITPVEGLILVLFTSTFAWISVAFWTAVLGFVLQALGRSPLSLGPSGSRVTGAAGGSGARRLSTRTAVVMPAHNEDPGRVLEGLASVLDSLERTGAAEHFHLFFLSDTTDPEIAAREEEAWEAWRERADRPEALFYRRRASNQGRKAGNIADFCRRWGPEYDFMVVLDADSVMRGETLVALAAAMEANRDAGLIQTVPVPARQGTLFGRLLQFAGCLYGPMFATGQSFWQGDGANYWGHNAILRVRPFIDHCRLPVLSGGPPMGGEILSHDFVEAALLRRAGWKTLLLPELPGSYEEVPGNLVDYATRDRRWAQGSLQHLRLLHVRGLRPINRLHFGLGAMGYLSSVLWLLMLLASTAYVLLAEHGPDPSSGASPTLLADWSLPEAASLVPLLAVTGIVLFLPKALGLMLALGSPAKGFGGRWRLAVSALLEALFAILVAPVMMMVHTRFVTGILAGRNVRWKAQVRGGRAVESGEAWRWTTWIALAGALWAGVTLVLSPFFFLWLTPIFAGLLLAAPLVRWTSSRRLGASTRRWGLFLVPSEVTPPAELGRGIPASEPTPPVIRTRRSVVPS
jgi:membrane glycosyltransferase